MEKHKNHKITHNIGECLGVMILKFIIIGGPKSKVVLKAPTTSAPPLQLKFL